jgi:hypothetical protein
MNENLLNETVGRAPALFVNPEKFKEPDWFEDKVIGFEQAIGKESGKPYIVLLLENKGKIRQYSFSFGKEGVKLKDLLNQTVAFKKNDKTGRFDAFIRPYTACTVETIYE